MDGTAKRQEEMAPAHETWRLELKPPVAKRSRSEDQWEKDRLRQSQQNWSERRTAKVQGEPTKAKQERVLAGAEQCEW